MKPADWEYRRDLCRQSILEGARSPAAVEAATGFSKSAVRECLMTFAGSGSISASSGTFSANVEALARQAVVGLIPKDELSMTDVVRYIVRALSTHPEGLSARSLQAQTPWQKAPDAFRSAFRALRHRTDIVKVVRDTGKRPQDGTEEWRETWILRDESLLRECEELEARARRLMRGMAAR